MNIKDRAREYIAEHSEYSEVFGQTFVAVDTMTAMVEFAEQETKALKEQIGKMKCCYNCSKWNDGECEESPKSEIFFCADFKCDNWEMFK